jgi:hypothetical protein
VVLRSEAKQLVGQDLIKALSDFKQMAVAPLSPHTQEFNSYVKKPIVEHPVDTRHFCRYHRTNLKCQRPVIKVVCDMLIRKWVFIKRNKQLSTISPCVGNLLPRVEYIHTPVRSKSEEDQLFGHELMPSVPPLPPSSRHEPPSNNEALVVLLKGNQCSYQQRKAKSKNLGVKVAETS